MKLPNLPDLPVAIWGCIVILVIFWAYAVVVALVSLVRLERERRLLDEWKSPSAQPSASKRCFERVKGLVSLGMPVDAAELADAALEESLPKGLPFARYVGQAAVYIGLAGALLGLQGAIGQLGTPQQSSVQEVEAYVQQISTVLSDFGAAFWAALAGIVVTLVVNVFFTAFDRKNLTVALLLEDRIRAKMLAEAGVSKKIDPAFEALQATARELARIISGTSPTIERTLAHMAGTAEGLRGMIQAAAESLIAVRQEFDQATASLAGSLEEGARAIQQSAEHVASTLGSASEAAGANIARSAEAGAESIRLQLASAQLANNTMSESVARLEVVHTAIQDHIKQIDESLSSVRSVHDALAKNQEAFRELTASHHAFAAGARKDLQEAMQPVVEELQDQLESINEMRSGFARALTAQHDFIASASVRLAEIPDEPLRERVESALLTASKVYEHQASEIVQEIKSLRSQVSAVAQVEKDGETLLQRLDALKLQLEENRRAGGVEVIRSQIDLIRRDLEVLKKASETHPIKKLFSKRGTE